jgi:predicted ABC-type ATPase
MSTMPRFFIVAGPNGAGKSTLGQAFVPQGVSIFNGDLVFAELCVQHPDIAPERLKGGVAVALERARDQALEQRKDFAFETNFSSMLVVDLIHLFRFHRYRIELIYFGLPDLATAVSRVETRTALGGHDIPNETIQFNLSEGIKMINQNLRFFDNASFISTSNTPQTIAHYTRLEQKLIIINSEVEWFNNHFKTSLAEMIKEVERENQIQEPKKKRGRRI